MRVLILSVADKRHMSMIAAYEEYLKYKRIKYDIIRINRYVPTDKVIHKKNELFEEYKFPLVETANKKKIYKLIPFLKFRNFAMRLMKEKKYDFFIIWNENTAILFMDFLLKNKQNYCLNLRDFLEIPFGDKLQKVLIKNAYFTTTPSSARPAGLYNDVDSVFTLYNRDTAILNDVVPKMCFKKYGDILNIVFMGAYWRAPDTFKRTVDILGNDMRYRLFFYGEGFDTELQEYACVNKIENVYTGGAFSYEETADYLKKTDIINSYYNNFETNPGLHYVSGVKQSYTPMLYIPAINDDNTTWAEISKKYGFSYLINDNNISSLGDDLYEWYFSLDFDVFKKNCDEFNRIVEESRRNIFKMLDKKLKVKQILY